MKKLILRTFTSDFNGEYYAECECAVVTLDQELLDVVRRRIAAAQAARSLDADAYEMYFWGGGESPVFYDYPLVEACEELGADILNETPFVLPDGYRP